MPGLISVSSLTSRVMGDLLSKLYFLFRHITLARLPMRSHRDLNRSLGSHVTSSTQVKLRNFSLLFFAPWRCRGRGLLHSQGVSSVPLPLPSEVHEPEAGGT